MAQERGAAHGGGLPHQSAIELDLIVTCRTGAQSGHIAIDRDPALTDPVLGLTTRPKSRPRENFLYTLGLWRSGRYTRLGGLFQVMSSVKVSGTGKAGTGKSPASAWPSGLGRDNCGSSSLKALMSGRLGN